MTLAIPYRMRTLAVVVIALLSPSLPTSAQDLDDGAIIVIYNQVNGFDIETALLSEVRGHSKTVRQLGRMVSSDHSGVRRMAHDLAREIGVVPDLPATRSADAMRHDQVIARLRGLSGPAFDRAYLEHEVAFHRAAIEAVRSVLLPAAEHPDIKAHFEAVLPAFEKHLAMTEAALAQMAAH